MGKPFIKIDIKEKRGIKSDSAVDYITSRPLYENSNLANFISYDFPKLYSAFEKGEIAHAYYTDFIENSGPARKLAISLVLELPVSPEGKPLEGGSKSIYDDIVKSFIKRFLGGFALVTEKDEESGERKAVCRRTALLSADYREKIEKGLITKLENYHMPIIYAIYLPEKGSGKPQPHCHMLISTAGFDEECFCDMNQSAARMFGRSIDNVQLSKVQFYYDVFEYYAEAVSEVITGTYGENVLNEVQKLYVNMKDYNILKNERKKFTLLANSCSKMEEQVLPYREKLLRKTAMSEKASSYKKIEAEMREVGKEKAFLNDIFMGTQSDSQLVGIIKKRNRLYKALIGCLQNPFYKFDNFIKAGKNQKMSYKGYKMLSDVIHGIDSRDIIKPKIRTDDARLVPYYYNFGSMHDFAMEISEKKDMDFSNRNIEQAQYDIKKLLVDYNNAVVSYNMISKEYAKKNKKIAFPSESIFNDATLSIIKDDMAGGEAIRRLVDKIARCDYIIQAGLRSEARTLSNSVKRFYETGKFDGEINELDPKEYVEGLEEVKYSNGNITYSTTYKSAKEKLAQLDEIIALDLEKLNNPDKLSKVENLAEFKQNYFGRQVMRRKIKEAVDFFDKVKRPSLINEYFLNMPLGSTRMTESRKERWKKAISRYKSDLYGRELDSNVKKMFIGKIEEINEEVKASLQLNER